MKILGMVLLLVFLQEAHAELIQKNDRDIYDLMWLPQARTVYGSSEFSILDSKVKLEVDGNLVSENKTTSTMIQQSAGYSLTDWLSLQAQIPYMLKQKLTDISVSGDEEVFEKKGTGDPHLSARLRVLDQVRHWFTLDLVPRMQFASGKKTEASSDRRGNNKLGGDLNGLRVEAGKKFVTLQWMGFIGYSQYLSAEGKALSLGKEFKIEPYPSIEAGIKILGFIDEKFLLQGSVTHTRDNKHKIKDKATVAYDELSNLNTTLFGGGLTYLYSPRLAVTGLFNLGAIEDYSTVNHNGFKVDYVQGTLTVISLSARYQF